MGKIKNKVYDFKDRLRDRKMLTLVVTLVAIILVLAVWIYKKQIRIWIMFFKEIIAKRKK